MNWQLWGLFVVTEGLLCVTPGPAVLLIVAQGLTRGIPASVSATFGVLTGNTIYFVLSATNQRAARVLCSPCLQRIRKPL